jgi:hypothetical protein
VPLHTKWMLVWEEPLTRSVTLCKGTPRAWLAHGERILVAHAPTSLGRFSINVTSLIGASPPRVVASIRLDAAEHTTAGAMPSEAAPRVSVRLRVPASFQIITVEMDGSAWNDVDTEHELVHLPHGFASVAAAGVARAEVVAHFSPVR